MRNGIIIDDFKSTGKYENLFVLAHALTLSKHFQLAQRFTHHLLCFIAKC